MQHLNDNQQTHPSKAILDNIKAIGRLHCLLHHSDYRLVSNIRCTSNISCPPTLGNSQLKFSPTISLAKTSNTRCTPSFDSQVSIVDKVWSGPTWSELLRVAWDFDSPWITGPMTAHQSVAYVRYIILAPAANLCTLSAIVFLPIKAWIWRHLCRYIDGSAILLTQMTKYFAMCHNENYVEWNGISIKSHQFVTNCPYQTIYSKHNICSYEFLLRFHDSFAGRLRNQIRTTWLWKIDTQFISSLILHNTTEIIIIIKWNVLFVEKKKLVTSSAGQKSPIDSM